MATRKEQREQRQEQRRHEEAEAQARAQRQRLVKLGSAAVFAAVIAVVAVIIVSQSGGGSSGGSTDLSGVAASNAEVKGLPQDGAFIGDSAAKVTLIEFGDLQCSTCKLYSEQIIPQLLSGPVKAGEARLEFRAWPIIGPQSVPAAEAAYAAGQQNRLWNFITIFYRNQGGENSGYVTDDFTTAVAKAAGVPDLEQWKSDRDDPRWKALLKLHDRQAANLGFSGTPSFAVQSNGHVRPIPGNLPPPLATLEAAIRHPG
jgi:protein-disulfide isomerase